MIQDPIVEEVYKVREKMLSECGGDLHKLVEQQKALAVPIGMKTIAASELPDAPRSVATTAGVS